jgi:protease IV
MEPIFGEKKKWRINFKLWNRQRDLKILKYIAIILVVTSSVIVIKDEVLYQLGYFDDALYGDDFSGDSSSGECNVSGISLRGTLVTYIPDDTADLISSDDILNYLEQAETDKDIKAIVLEINSYGGSAVAAEEIANALKRVTKPTVAFIRDGGVSAAYWAATGADMIFASKNSDVGSIGVTMSYLDYVGQNQKEGFTYNQLSAGKFKDTGSPDKPLSQEEKNLLMRDVNIIHQNFIKAVAENRKLDITKVVGLADGSTMLGEMALKNGLIDGIGRLFEANEYLKGKIGEDAVVCWQ